jgi:hypothetical protein
MAEKWPVLVFPPRDSNSIKTLLPFSIRPSDTIHSCPRRLPPKLTVRQHTPPTLVHHGDIVWASIPVRQMALFEGRVDPCLSDGGREIRRRVIGQFMSREENVNVGTHRYGYSRRVRYYALLCASLDLRRGR